MFFPIRLVNFSPPLKTVSFSPCISIVWTWPSSAQSTISENDLSSVPPRLPSMVKKIAITATIISRYMKLFLIHLLFPIVASVPLPRRSHH